MSVECMLKNVAKTVGEAPHWNHQTRTLLHVDVEAGDVHRWNSVTGEDEIVHLEDSVSLVVPCTNGGYIVTQGNTLAHLDWDTHTVTKLHGADKEIPNKFNDGKCDEKGRLWAGESNNDGTMGKRTGPGPGLQLEMGTSHLYCMDLDGALKSHLDGVSLSNGLTWSPDNTIMYYTDSLTRNIDAFDFDLENGIISNRRVVIDFNKHSVEDYGYPDGMTIDVEGKIWIACPLAGKVIRFDPETGTELKSIVFPVKTPSSCCFGGNNLDELYVTSLKPKGMSEAELAKYPLTGSLFKVTGLGVKGFPGVSYSGKVA